MAFPCWFFAFVQLPIFNALVLRGNEAEDPGTGCVDLKFGDNMQFASTAPAGGTHAVYSNVAEFGGKHVDLRVTIDSANANLGIHDSFGKIGMAENQDLTGTFEFIRPNGDPVTIFPCVHFSVLDIESSGSSGSERVLFNPKEFAHWPSYAFSQSSILKSSINEHGMLVIGAHPGTRGTAKPSSPNMLKQEQLANSVSFTFHDISNFTLRFRTPPSGNRHAFFFGGHVPAEAADNLEPAKAQKWMAEEGPVHPVQENKRKPNIIWVMADDLGWGEVGLYPAESVNGRIKTPFLDKFGREGIRFTNAYSGYSVCAPSRTAFFTGLHAGRFAKHNLSGVTMGPESKVLNLAQMLQNAGYWTGAIGKISPFEKPLSQGWDRFVGTVDQSECHDMYPAALDRGNERHTYPLPLNARPKFRELCMMHRDQFNYSVDVFHSLAVKWVKERAQTPEAPFFLYLAYTVPHAGGYNGIKTEGNPVPHNKFYWQETWKVVEKDHASVVTYMDALFGEFMDTIKEAGIDDNTIVFFASDNGAHQEGHHNHNFFNSSGGFRGNKRSIYEGGVRSPTMVRWPGHIKPNSVSNLAWAFWDVMPTLADIVGYTYSMDDPLVDQISIAPTLFGEDESQAWHHYLYFTWDGGYSIRMGHFKGVVNLSSVPMMPAWDDDMELFNLLDDPFEEDNVALDHNSTVYKMKSLVIDRIADGRCYQCYARGEWKEQWAQVGFSLD